MEQLAMILRGEVGSSPLSTWVYPWEQSQNPKGYGTLYWEVWEKMRTGGSLSIYAVLDALPMVSLFPIPLGVVQRLEKIRRSFLWQGNKEKSKNKVGLASGICNNTRPKLWRSNGYGDMHKSLKPYGAVS